MLTAALGSPSCVSLRTRSATSAPNRAPRASGSASRHRTTPANRLRTPRSPSTPLPCRRFHGCLFRYCKVEMVRLRKSTLSSTDPCRFKTLQLDFHRPIYPRRSSCRKYLLVDRVKKGCFVARRDSKESTLVSKHF